MVGMARRPSALKGQAEMAEATCSISNWTCMCTVMGQARTHGHGQACLLPGRHADRDGGMIIRIQTLYWDNINIVEHVVS